MANYKPTKKKKDLKEIKSLLIFISGITEKTPIRRVEFTKYKDLDVISIDRWLMNLKANF